VARDLDRAEWVVLALLVIAIALGRGARFIAAWGPFPDPLLRYERCAVSPPRQGSRHTTFQAWSARCSAAPCPRVTLQHDFYNPNVVGAQDLVAMFFYFHAFPAADRRGLHLLGRSRDITGASSPRCC